VTVPPRLARLRAQLGRAARQEASHRQAVGDLPFERNAPYAPTRDNRPVPLDRGPLGLTRDDGWQMSFGERAALEGVLAQLSPGLALEIGTAEGGSLERIAAYSTEVHSIDVTHEPVKRALPSRVTFHTGSSAQLLAPLLESFVAAGRQLDFALVDGDHSYEGVRADLASLLGSEATVRCAILVHDTMNAEIRAGIESLRFDDYAKVVYYELDFVPGYMYREGDCSGAVWGGLGLLLTDVDRSPDYPLGPRQSRYYEPFPLFQRLRREVLQDGAVSELRSGYPCSNAVNPGFGVPAALSSPPELAGGSS
jgi:hypothetical protein